MIKTSIRRALTIAYLTICWYVLLPYFTYYLRSVLS